MFSNPGLNFESPMCPESIPDHEYISSWEVELELFEKGNAFACRNIAARVKPEEKLWLATTCCSGNGADSRDFFVRPGLGFEDRSLPTRCPCSFDDRRELNC
jgi:hypothetical protein